MTIFRSELIVADSLKYAFTSANEPDIIGVEVSFEGNVLIDVAMDSAGKTSVLFDQDGGSMEFDLTDLRLVLDKCERELSAWRERLILSGAAWDPNQ